jgi:hypothetical protein
MVPRLFALLLALAATPALAQVTLLDQWAATPATPSGGPNSDTNLGAPFAGEDFVLASGALVSQLEVRGAYQGVAAPNSPVAFSVAVRSDIGGLPGTVVSSASSVSVAQTLLGNTGVALYSFTLDLSPALSLAAGTYWLDLRETTGDASLFFRWELADATDPIHGRAGFATGSEGTSWAGSAGALSLRIRGTLTPVELLDASVE